MSFMSGTIEALPEGVAGLDPYARDEMNLAEFPIALLTDRPPAGLTMITREVQTRDERTGVVLTRKVTVTGSDVYGIPTASDNLVLLGLIYLTKRANNFRERRVWFTRSELIKVLEWPGTGPSYDRVQTSLCRWANVFILYENSWWERPRQAYATKGFGIIDDFEVVDAARSRQPNLFRSNFAWNEVFFQSLEDGFVRSLDLKTLLRLRHPTSQQMYRFLGKHFYRSPTLTLDLRAFACEHVGLDRGYKDNGKLKEKLQPALAELEAIGFLEPMPRDRRYAKVGRGQWTITLVRKSGVDLASGAGPASRARPARAEAPPPAPSPLVAELTGRGVTPATAVELAAAVPDDEVRARIEAFDWLVARRDRRVSRNPGGYLVESIRKGYAPPKGFESTADRDRRRGAEAEQRRKVEAARIQAEAEQRARQEVEQARIRAYWDALAPADRACLEAAALAEPGLSFLTQQYRRNRHDPERAERYRRMILDAHILGLLNRGGDETIDVG
jgi:hypothetical protein